MFSFLTALVTLSEGEDLLLGSTGPQQAQVVRS